MYRSHWGCRMSALSGVTTRSRRAPFPCHTTWALASGPSASSMEAVLSVLASSDCKCWVNRKASEWQNQSQAF